MEVAGHGGDLCMYGFFHLMGWPIVYKNSSCDVVPLRCRCRLYVAIVSRLLVTILSVRAVTTSVVYDDL